MTGRHLVIVCGLPGSGKTTVARDLEDRLGAVRLCVDDWMEAFGINLWNEGLRLRMEHLQWDVGRAVLRAGGSVVVEWGTWSRQERDALRAEARELGATVELIFLDAPLDVLWTRISNRNRERPPITRADLEEWDRLIERPTPAEVELFDRTSPDS